MESAMELFRRNRFWVLLGAAVLAALALYWALYGGSTPAAPEGAVFVSQMNEEETLSLIHI